MESRLRQVSKVGCVFPMAFDSVLPRAGFGANDYQEDAPILSTTH